MRILKGSTYTYRLPPVVDVDGETAVDATTLPTVSVTRDDGTVLAAPTVTHVADTGDLGDYTAAFTTTHTSQCDRLTVTSTITVNSDVQVYTELVEVVGAHYVTVAQIRNEPGMENDVDFPTDLLIELRDDFEDMVEDIIGFALVPRYQRDQLDSRLALGSSLDGVYGPDPMELMLTKVEPRALLSVKINGVSKTLSEFTLYPWGKVRWNMQAFPPRTPTDGARNCVFCYEHGRLSPSPLMRREALKWIRAEAKGRVSQANPNMISQTVGGEVMRMSTPDDSRGRPTGILSLDPLLVRLRASNPGIG